jgi:uncharacterized protein (DUF1786 family)
MMLLAIDVGMGTQDILLYDSQKNIENCFKMVLPSQTRIIAQKITGETALKRDIVLTGETMGGGPCYAAVNRHMLSGLAVFATEKAALTLNDSLDKIKEMGVVIVKEDEVKDLKASLIKMGDIDKPALSKAFALFGVHIPKNFAIAVQDHGFSPDRSNRVFRFEYFMKIIEKGATLDSFAYRENIPPRFSRMKAVERILPGAMLMDTGIAAIRGALLDEHAHPPHLVINIGNAHTLAGIIDQGKLIALMEHHTQQMTSEKLDDYLMRLCKGTLGFNEVFDDGGHGCYAREAIGYENIGSILVTGPSRQIMRGSKLECHFASPSGDMMLTGCFGLVDAYINYAKEQKGQP